MQDVRRYLADALIMYGSLVEFAPAPGKGAICYRLEVVIVVQCQCWLIVRGFVKLSFHFVPREVTQVYSAVLRSSDAGQVTMSHSRCHTEQLSVFIMHCSGQALLAQFGFPFESDRQLMLETYPWLGNLTQPGCPVAAAASGSGTSPSAGDIAAAAQHQGGSEARSTAAGASGAVGIGSGGGAAAAASAGDAAAASAGGLKTGAGIDAVKAAMRVAAQTAGQQT